MTFAEALAFHMGRHGDTNHHLERVLAAVGTPVNRTTLRSWRRGLKSPQCSASLRVLAVLERRYRLPENYLRSKISAMPRGATMSQSMDGIARSERRRLAWHLPDNFDVLPRVRREEILSWVRGVVLSGATEYRRYQAATRRHSFALRFACEDGVPGHAPV